MIKIFVNEGTLTDDSKVYDLVIRDFNQEEREDCLRINCPDQKSALKLGAKLELVIQQLAYLQVNFSG